MRLLRLHVKKISLRMRDHACMTIFIDVNVDVHIYIYACMVKLIMLFNSLACLPVMMLGNLLSEEFFS